MPAIRDLLAGMLAQSHICQGTSACRAWARSEVWGSGSWSGSLLGTYLSSLAHCAWLQLIQHVHLHLGPGQEGKKQRPGLSTGLVALTWLGVGCCMHASRPRGGPPPVKAWQPQLARQQPGQHNDLQ